MNFEELIKNRYSCRAFTDQPVESDKIIKIIEAARVAPTAVNKQPFHIFHIASDHGKNAVRRCTRCHFGAESFLIVGARPEEGWIRPFDNRSFSDIDAAIAATHMMLMIEALGLATTWVGYFDAPALKASLPQLENFDLIAIFPIGYPAEKASPRHRERKSLDHIFSVL